MTPRFAPGSSGVANTLSFALGIGRCSSSTSTPLIRTGLPNPAVTSPSPRVSAGTIRAATLGLSGAGETPGSGAADAAGLCAPEASAVDVSPGGGDDPPPPPPPPPVGG